MSAWLYRLYRGAWEEIVEPGSEFNTMGGPRCWSFSTLPEIAAETACAAAAYLSIASWLRGGLGNLSTTGGGGGARVGPVAWLLQMALAATLAWQVYLKAESHVLLALLQPCHVAAIGFILALNSEGSSLGVAGASIGLCNCWGYMIALAMPDYQLSGLGYTRLSNPPGARFPFSPPHRGASVTARARHDPTITRPPLGPGALAGRRWTRSSFCCSTT
jgi:hypothetical protein